MKAGRIGVVALAFLASAPMAQYRWVDQSGQVNYGDAPPADARDLRRINERAVGATESGNAVPFEVRRAMAQFPVTLYSSDECRPCDYGRTLLAKRGIPFSERLIDSIEATAELKRLTGTDKVPVLAVGRDIQAGFDSLKWDRALDAAGYPAQIASRPANRPAESLVARSPNTNSPPAKAATSP